MKTAGCLIFTKPNQSQLVKRLKTHLSLHVLWKHSTSEAQLIMKIARVTDDVPKFLENPIENLRSGPPVRLLRTASASISRQVSCGVCGGAPLHKLLGASKTRPTISRSGSSRSNHQPGRLHRQWRFVFFRLFQWCHHIKTNRISPQTGCKP